MFPATSEARACVSMKFPGRILLLPRTGRQQEEGAHDYRAMGGMVVLFVGATSRSRRSSSTAGQQQLRIFTLLVRAP